MTFVVSNGGGDLGVDEGGNKGIGGDGEFDGEGGLKVPFVVGLDDRVDDAGKEAFKLIAESTDITLVLSTF